MPQVSAAVLRSTPSRTSASASIRRAAALSFSPLAALRSSDAVRSSRVIDTAAPIDAAPLKSQHRVRVSPIWESPMSHIFGPLVLEPQAGIFRLFGRVRLILVLVRTPPAELAVGARAKIDENVVKVAHDVWISAERWHPLIVGHVNILAAIDNHIDKFRVVHRL